MSPVSVASRVLFLEPDNVDYQEPRLQIPAKRSMAFSNRLRLSKPHLMSEVLWVENEEQVSR